MTFIFIAIWETFSEALCEEEILFYLCLEGARISIFSITKNMSEAKCLRIRGPISNGTELYEAT